MAALGLDKWEIVEGDGFARGIWMGWKDQLTDIQVLQANFQFIHVKITKGGNRSWFFTAIYANLAQQMKNKLWTELLDISHHMTGAWLVAGDLNDIRDPTAKKVGALFNWNRALVCNDRINRCLLLEIETMGGRFTWKGPHIQGYDPFFERLDRALCNVNWRLLFNEAKALLL